MNWAIVFFGLWLIISLMFIVRMGRRKIRDDAPNEAQIRAAAAALGEADLRRIESELQESSLTLAPETARLLFAAYALMQKVTVAEMDVSRSIYALVNSLAVVEFIVEAERILGIEIPEFDGRGRFSEGSVLDLLDIVSLRTATR